MRRALLFLSAAALTFSATAVPAQYAVRRLDPRLIQQAQKEHAQVVEQFGGEEPGPRGAYVDAVGKRVAAFSGIANPAAAYRFTLLNSAVENAFSVPGGYIYITRQLMSLMDDEAELAFALGHEVGHVAAAHAQEREQAERQAVWQQLPWIMMGRIFGGNFGTAVAARGLLTAELQTLRFSREQEYEADDLGLRYMVAAGYNPSGAAEILAALTRNSALQARVQGSDNRKLPEWASTHPLSENRMQRALVEARQTGRLGTGITNRNAFLDRVDGMYVDDDPEQGVIDGRTSGSSSPSQSAISWTMAGMRFRFPDRRAKPNSRATATMERSKITFTPRSARCWATARPRCRRRAGQSSTESPRLTRSLGRGRRQDCSTSASSLTSGSRGGFIIS